MKVLICGYGRMGQEIESVLLTRGHEVTARVDPDPSRGDAPSLSAELLERSEGVIEFSLPGGVVTNAALYYAAGIPAVVGTTGWEADRDTVQEMYQGKQGEQAGAALLYGSNFSIGANLFRVLSEFAAQIIGPIQDYDVMMLEKHHSGKQDSPSGTAITVAESLLQAHPRKNRIVTNRLDRRIEPDELHVASLRGGSVPGTHSVEFDSPADTISITHTARNRGGFALGAVLGLEWLSGRTGFFSVENFIEDVVAQARRNQA
ncbi:MAG: 4-hydroxy-tetrahydrodipicolinate reductase [Spirochaetaceae bacterium]|nr:MAG: 4-hydroxy-tetrahydrodipicolinate reductase [Spirochaetaceae bacterium]